MTPFNFKKYNPNSSTEAVSLWQKIKENNNYRMVLGAIVGAIAGLLYWNFVGCSSGSCGLTSNPYKTVGLFTLLGVFMANKNKCGGAC